MNLQLLRVITGALIVRKTHLNWARNNVRRFQTRRRVFLTRKQSRPMLTPLDVSSINHIIRCTTTKETLATQWMTGCHFAETVSMHKCCEHTIYHFQYLRSTSLEIKLFQNRFLWVCYGRILCQWLRSTQHYQGFSLWLFRHLSKRRKDRLLRLRLCW